MAATGLLGMSVSESFVQVQRIKVYGAGIHALECALGAYATVIPIAQNNALLAGSKERGAATNAEALNPHAPSLDAFRQAEQKGTEAVAEWSGRAKWHALRVDAAVAAEMDAALADALSDITQQVDDVLLGTILSVQSRSPSLAPSFAIPPATEKPKLAARAVSNPQEALLIADVERELAELEVRASLAEAAKARMSQCSITSMTIPPETIPVALGVDRLGQAEPIATAQGRVTVRVFGGSGQYTAAVVGSTPAVITQSVADGQAFVSIDTAKVPLDTAFAVSIVDRLRPASSVRVSVVVKKAG
jgi:hypothetical protein